MGIRFRCPNGHKIHVKSFLAGKRGICPVCGLKVPIPQQSDPEFADRPAKKRQTSPRTAAPPNSASRCAAQPAAATTGTTGDGPLSLPSSTAEFAPEPSPELAASAASQPVAALTQVDTISAGAGIVSDPIAAAPHARWFVRPPSGGQFGPAPGNLLREWMNEGRVTPETYVWREGWPEWQRAQEVFGDFGLLTADVVPQLPEVAAASEAMSTSQLYRQRKSTKTTIVVVSLLGLACALLFAALVYVVRFMD